MKLLELKHSPWIRAMALFALLFGLLTILSGGSVLFNSEVRQLAGNYIGFVLWFNFLAGFTYVIAGIGLWTWQRWSMWLSFSIAVASLIVFVAFGLHILSGGEYETRTIGAMSLRTLAWFFISVVAYKNLNLRPEI